MAESQTPVPAGKLRLIADLPEVDLKTLKALADKKGMSLTQALSFAISAQKQLSDVQSSGDSLLLERNGNLSKLTLSGIS